jgi:hypothetical protein
MKTAIIAGLVALSILLTSCGKKIHSESGSDPASKAPPQTASPHQRMDASPAAAQVAHPVSSPVTQPVLAMWQEGDKPGAVSLFVETDWSGRPLFPSGMALSLSQNQFQALPDVDRQLKSGEMTAQLDLMKQIAAAVAQAGRDAAAKGDIAQARKCFISLKQFGTALDSPNCLRLLQLVGQVSTNMADTELARIGK